MLLSQILRERESCSLKGKVSSQIHIFNCRINVDFDAELLPDGSLRLTYNEPLILPRGSFVLGVVKDWR